MARKTARPGRTLGVFFLGLAIAFGLVALTGTWKPELGLDLQGGTSIRLTPKGSPTPDALNEARKIIDARVNGSGVSEAQVTVQGNKYIVVQIPGQSRRDLVDTVRRQAQLRFRIVACSTITPGPCAATSSTDGSASPGTGVTAPSATSSPGAGVIAPSATASATTAPSASGSASDSGSQAASPSGTANRAPANYTRTAHAHDTAPSASASASASPAATGTGSASASATAASATASGSVTASPSAGASASASSTPSGQATPAPDGGKGASDGLTWAESPNDASVAAYNAFTCPTDNSAVDVEDDPDKPLVTCDDSGIKYLLSTATIEGSELSNAKAEIPSQQVNWVVSLSFDKSGTKQFTAISKALYGTERQFAIVLDGQLISAPTMDALITNGQAQISGNFTEASADSLATSLKFGALPVQFGDFTAETVGPSLAGDQLTAGITAGIAGLILVMLYCLFYYRGLGIVVIGSLVVAGAATYAMVLLLAKTAGFTLTLPGIAGLIVAVGITADSFIVYFERIRDEMREGRSMRVAVEAGWVRARATCLAADAVSLLAAIVLYIFTASVVRGFAFALGLSTAIDLVVFFFFTKPFVSALAKVSFFNRGHRLSGLGAETLGIDKVATDRPARTSLGTAREAGTGRGLGRGEGRA